LEAIGIESPQLWPLLHQVIRHLAIMTYNAIHDFHGTENRSSS